MVLCFFMLFPNSPPPPPLPPHPGVRIQMFGDFFGPRQPNLVTHVVAHSPTFPTAGTLQAHDCAPYDSSHTQLRCTIPTGVGRGFRWSVTVAGTTSSPSVLTTSYGPPVITSLSVSSAQGSVLGSAGVPTRGGAVVTLFGINFGEDEGQVGCVALSTLNTTLTLPAREHAFATNPVS